MNFNNNDYINISTDLIHDIFYSNISSRGRISSIRQYSEILIRKILDINPKKQITVGDITIVKSLKKKSNIHVTKLVTLVMAMVLNRVRSLLHVASVVVEAKYKWRVIHHLVV
mgnify:CR=1 FL=1